MDFDRFYEMALPYIRQTVTKDYDLKKIAQMVKTRIEIFRILRSTSISLKTFRNMMWSPVYQ